MARIGLSPPLPPTLVVGGLSDCLGVIHYASAVVAAAGVRWGAVGISADGGALIRDSGYPADEEDLAGIARWRESCLTDIGAPAMEGRESDAVERLFGAAYLIAAGCECLILDASRSGEYGEYAWLPKDIIALTSLPKTADPAFSEMMALINNDTYIALTTEGEVSRDEAMKDRCADMSVPHIRIYSWDEMRGTADNSIASLGVHAGYGLLGKMGLPKPPLDDVWTRLANLPTPS